MTRLAPYAEQHKSPEGPGDARPTASQVVEDQGLVSDPSWTGRVILITGCSPGGIGPETAKAMHLTGADVYITVRDMAKGAQVAEEILADGKPGKVEVIQMDLSSLESVRAGVDVFLLKSGNKLNVLINNAGVMFCPYGKTQEGFELHFVTNHLGHFYLFHLVKAALLSSASPSFNSRVISLSSSAHRYGAINFDSLNPEEAEHDARLAYGQSKLANVHFANELDRRYRHQNLRATTVHPGGIFTPIARYLPTAEDFVNDPDILRSSKSPAQGAATSVWAAIAKELEGQGGIYLDDVSEAELAPPNTAYYLGGYAAQAFDAPTEKKLWEKSLELTRLGHEVTEG